MLGALVLTSNVLQCGIVQAHDQIRIEDLQWTSVAAITVTASADQKMIDDLLTDGVDETLARNLVIAEQDVVNLLMNLLGVALGEVLTLELIQCKILVVIFGAMVALDVSGAIVVENLLELLQLALAQISGKIVIVRVWTSVGLHVQEEADMIHSPLVRRKQLFVQDILAQCIKHGLVSNNGVQYVHNEGMDNHDDFADVGKSQPSPVLGLILENGPQDGSPKLLIIVSSGSSHLRV